LDVVIGITGLAGSGKSLLSDYLEKKGLGVFQTGNIVREIAISRNVSYTSLGEISLEFLPYDNTEIIERICDKISKSYHEKYVIIEGIKKISEVEYLRKNYSTYMVAILSSQNIRFNRLLKRNRYDDPVSIDYLKKRDEIELKYGIGNVIALADFYIINDGEKEKMIGDFLAWLNGL